MEVKKGIRAVILGSSGSGKSTLGRLILLQYLKRNLRDRYYVLDVYDTHIRGNEVVPGLAHYGFKVVGINADTLDAIPIQASYEAKIETYDWKALLAGIPRAVIWIELPPELRANAASYVARAIRELGNATVLIDEVTNFIGNTDRKANEVGMLITSGRPRGVDTICISQHANFTNPLLRDSANYIISFRCTSDREIEILSSKFREAEKLRDLSFERREFIVSDVERGLQYISTIDAGRAFL